MIDRTIMRGLLKICILSCASEGKLYGLGLMQQMRRCGFAVSPGTLYPNLETLLREGDLLREAQVINGKRRIVYRLSPKGRKELRETRAKLRRLDRQIFGSSKRRRDA